jgi:hypothetical protein
MRRDETMPVQNWRYLCSDCTDWAHHLSLFSAALGLKNIFLPNEPKVVQCLLGFLKKQLLTKGTETAQKPLKTDLKDPETDTNEAKTTPFSP